MKTKEFNSVPLAEIRGNIVLYDPWTDQIFITSKEQIENLQKKLSNRGLLTIEDVYEELKMGEPGSCEEDWFRKNFGWSCY